jgi:hypothetical protein
MYMNAFNLSSKLLFGAVLLTTASCAYAQILGLGGPVPVTVTNTPSVSIANTPSVTVTNTMPIMVRDFGQPFAAHCASSNVAGSSPTCALATVPAGKVLVIEMVTVELYTGATEPSPQALLVVQTNGANVGHFLDITTQAPNPKAAYPQELLANGTFPVRFYADSNSAVVLQLQGLDYAGLVVGFYGTLSGYLTNAP